MLELVCLAYTDQTASMKMLLADSSNNDRLVKLCSHIDQTCFEFINVSYFGAVNFLLQNTPDAVFR